MGGLFSKKEIKLVVVGLDNSGKTTMIKSLKPQKNQTNEGTTPTVGYQIEQFQKDDINFTMLDMSGQGKYREMWSKYCNEVDGIIFVIDASDKLRFCIVQDEIENLFNEPEIKNNPIPILFFANKMDSPTAVKPQELYDAVDLKQIKNREYHVQESNALTGEGIEAGLKWLDQKIQQRKQQQQK